MAQAKNTKNRILTSALQEFSSLGFSGARMEKIAQRADINKAMLFYYFSSKENLYQEVLKHTIKKIVPKIRNIVVLERNPERFLEKLPAIYIRFFSRNQDFVKMIAFDFVQRTEMITKTFEETIGKGFRQGPKMLLKKIENWHKKGKISESEPIHFMVNIISLCLFAFIARPIIETIFNADIGHKDFYESRVKSVVNILKQGMLK
jgi:AcrR family transcriptional regulator